MNLPGRVFVPIDCPFRKADEILPGSDVPFFVDFHAEASSEKKALGHYLDGQVSGKSSEPIPAVRLPMRRSFPQAGLHQRCGMTGGHRSSIGMKFDGVLPRFLTGMPSKFEVSGDGLALNGVLLTLDDETGRAMEISRIFERLSR
ncbi:hypothetical protein MASR2M17_15610 [Aminivibrio sp.]